VTSAAFFVLGVLSAASTGLALFTPRRPLVVGWFAWVGGLLPCEVPRAAFVLNTMLLAGDFVAETDTRSEATAEVVRLIVDEFVLRRTREIKQWDMGIRHMNASSNAYRYYIMRNRAHIKHYYRSLGVYRPVLFGLGTALTFAKELIRLLFVERKVRGTSNLFRGIRTEDGPLVVGFVSVLVIVFLVVNLLVDLLYAALDPRIRYE